MLDGRALSLVGRRQRRRLPVTTATSRRAVNVAGHRAALVEPCAACVGGAPRGRGRALDPDPPARRDVPLRARRPAPDAPRRPRSATSRRAVRSSRPSRGMVAWRFGGFGGVRSLLDFASGYGRSTRFLVAALDARRGSRSPRSIRPPCGFRRRRSACAGVVSARDPERSPSSGPFDVVLRVVVLQPSARARASRPGSAALRYGLVAAGGVLIFSVARHGAAAGGRVRMALAGIVFRAGERDAAPARRRSTGRRRVTPEFVRRACRRARRRPEARLVALPVRAVRLAGSLRPLPAAAFRRDRIRARRACPRGRPATAAVENGDRHRAGLGRGRPRRAAAGRAALRRRAVAERLPGAGRRRAPGGDWRFAFPAVGDRARTRVVRIEAGERARRMVRILGRRRRCGPYLPGLDESVIRYRSRDGIRGHASCASSSTSSRTARASSCPSYATPGSAGCDLRAAVAETADARCRARRTLVPTGHRGRDPRRATRARCGCAAASRSRSGLSLLNGPGHDRQRLPRRDPGHPREPRRRAGHDRARRAHRAARDRAGRARALRARSTTLPETSRDDRAASGRPSERVTGSRRSDMVCPSVC